MKLKKLLEGSAWERKPGQPLPTLKDVAKKYNLNEAPELRPGEFDYQYFIDQVGAAFEAVEAVEEELVRTLEGLAEDEAVYGLVRDKAEQGANQTRRYINGAQKQLEGLQKMLDRAQRTGEYDA